MTTTIPVMYGGYELQQISMIAAGDTISRLWYRVRSTAGGYRYAVAYVRTAAEIAPAIALYERDGTITGP